MMALVNWINFSPSPSISLSLSLSLSLYPLHFSSSPIFPIIPPAPPLFSHQPFAALSHGEELKKSSCMYIVVTLCASLELPISIL